MVGDLGAESFALERVSHRSIARGPDYSRRTSSDGVTSLLQSKHRDLKTFALFADPISRRHTHVLQRKITGVASANAELAVNRPGSEALHAALDYEARHARVIALAPFLFVSPTKEKEVVGDIRETDPHLL